MGSPDTKRPTEPSSALYFVLANKLQWGQGSEAKDHVAPDLETQDVKQEENAPERKGGLAQEWNEVW